MSEIMPPMYQQVKNYLIRKIESKEYAEGEKLPSERDLSDKFQVSRMTARNAILELVKEGYVYRDGARGTIVSPRKVKRNFLSAAGFTEHQRESGVCDSRTRLIEAGLTEADAWLSSRLNIPLGTECFRLLRLRIGNGTPVAVDEAYIPKRIAPTLLDHDFSEESLWDVLETVYGHRPTHTKATVEIVSFEERETGLMELPEGQTGFKVIYSNYDQDHTLMEYTITYYRGDLFLFEYEMSR